MFKQTNRREIRLHLALSHFSFDQNPISTEVVLSNRESISYLFVRKKIYSDSELLVPMFPSRLFTLIFPHNGIEAILFYCRFKEKRLMVPSIPMFGLKGFHSAQKSLTKSNRSLSSESKWFHPGPELTIRNGVTFAYVEENKKFFFNMAKKTTWGCLVGWQA